MRMIFADKLFTSPAEIIQADGDLRSAFSRIEELRADHYLLGYVRYDEGSPQLYFAAYDSYQAYQPKSEANFVLKPRSTLSYPEYAQAIAEIKDQIACGNTYEVNYTYDLLLPFSGDELELYEYLLKSQSTPYNAFIANEYDTVLSFSPELFFQLDGRRIITKPMKGTVRRGKDAEEDTRLREFLATDPKNRAENVMIVDLLRNDLGRIAKTGSVQVSKLFQIETHPTLHQMTSQIEAELRDEVSLYDIFQAIFPCGSITGAPKISTMRIIRDVEKGQRGIYCGAIGFLSPDQAIFSVPIRILQRPTGSDTFTYRVGGAIVWDSDAEDEWLETLTKTRFLYGDFQLVETMALKNGEIVLEEEHFMRLREAAQHYGFTYAELSAEERAEVRRQGTEQGQEVLRVALSRSGELTLEYRQLAPTEKTLPISPLRTNGEEFLFYKTSYRPYYNSEQIFFNRKGELTESSIANIVLQIDGRWYTPPVCCGLLNGLLRQSLVDQGKCEERILYLSDLKRAQRVFCLNSVRGIWEVSVAFN